MQLVFSMLCIIYKNISNAKEEFMLSAFRGGKIKDAA